MNGHGESNGRGNDVVSDRSDVFPTIYCLYPNHPHFIVEDADEDKGFGDVGFSPARPASDSR